MPVFFLLELQERQSGIDLLAVVFGRFREHDLTKSFGEAGLWIPVRVSRPPHLQGLKREEFEYLYSPDKIQSHLKFLRACDSF